MYHDKLTINTKQETQCIPYTRLFEFTIAIISIIMDISIFTEQESCPDEDSLSGILYLPNNQISASGSLNGYEPWHGRLQSPTGWIADTFSDGSFFQVRFNRYVHRKCMKEIANGHRDTILQGNFCIQIIASQ